MRCKKDTTKNDRWTVKCVCGWLKLLQTCTGGGESSPNRPTTTVKLFGRVFWTVFTVNSPFHHPVPHYYDHDHYVLCVVFWKLYGNRPGNVNILSLHIQRRWQWLYVSCGSVAHHLMAVLCCWEVELFDQLRSFSFAKIVPNFLDNLKKTKLLCCEEWTFTKVIILNIGKKSSFDSIFV